MSSRTSPVRTRPKPQVPHGFLPSKPKPRDIKTLTVRELQDLHVRNAKILSQPASSTATYVPRITAEQAAIEARLIDLVGVDIIQTLLRRTNIKGEDDMNVDVADPPTPSSTVETKRRILNRFSAQIPNTHNGSDFTFQDAVRIEQEAHAIDKKRQEEALERKRRMGLPIKGEILTHQEKNARMMAFLNYKPTDSDIEDDSDFDEDDDEDPAGWFEDDQDDGRKGQDIVEPDYEDISDIIRIDDSRIAHNIFYEPNDGD
ncbi:hypothetical protein ABKN59_000353 [Abortiporus biennis]